MHSFQPSRGRILFEVFCALAVVASMVGTWQQTQAWALLTAAAAAGLYSMVRLFDLIRDDPVRAEEPQRIDFAADGQADLSTVKLVAEPEAAGFAGPVVIETVEEPARTPTAVEARPSKPVKSRKPARAPRKTKADQPVEAHSFVESTAAQVPEPVEPVSEQPVEPGPDQVVEFPMPVEDHHHPHVAPLFEPDPFGRMPRRAFGRKAG